MRFEAISYDHVLNEKKNDTYWQKVIQLYIMVKSIFIKFI